MYSFEPSEEQQMLVDAIRRYAINDLRAKAHDADEEASLPPELVEKGWELGFLQASSRTGSRAESSRQLTRLVGV